MSPAPARAWSRLGPILPVALAAALLAVVKDFDSDVFWHLAAGQRVLETGRVRLGDEFSWTAKGEAFINHEWLAGVGMALVERAAGLRGLVAAKALLVGLVWLALGLAALARGAAPFPAAWALLWALVLARFRFLVKPELLSFLLLAVFDGLAGRYLERGGRRYLALLVVLAALWGNLHLLVVLGIAVLGAHAVGAWIERRQAPAAAGKGSPARLLAAAAVAAAATLANPYGIRLYEPVLKIYSAPAIVGMGVREWAPPRLAEFVPFYLLAPLALLLLLLDWRGLRARDALLYAGPFLAALRSLRHIGAFAVVAAPVVALALTRLSPKLHPAWRRPAPSLGALIVATLAATGILLSPRASLLHQDQSRFFRFGLGIAADAVPARAMDFVLGHGLEGPLYNTYELGGYLVWRGWPRLAVFLDGRHYVYERFLAWLQARPPERALAELGIRLAVVGYRDRAWLAALRASGEFSPVVFDDAALVFVRKDVLAARGDIAVYCVLRPEDLASAGPEALGETERAVREAPDCLRAWLARGAALRRGGRTGEALEAYRRALAIDPAQASAWNNLGLVLLEERRFEEARRAFRRALALDPSLLPVRRNLDAVERAPGK